MTTKFRVHDTFEDLKLQECSLHEAHHLYYTDIRETEKERVSLVKRFRFEQLTGTYPIDILRNRKLDESNELYLLKGFSQPSPIFLFQDNKKFYVIVCSDHIAADEADVIYKYVRKGLTLKQIFDLMKL